MGERDGAMGQPVGIPVPVPVVIAPTRRGCEVAAQWRSHWPTLEIWTQPTYGDGATLQSYGESLVDWLGQRWGEGRPLVFVLAVGAVVRTIAPLLRDKFTDPAVVAIDEGGRAAIALVGGHGGGGEAIARQVAALTGGEAIITTGSDGQGLPAIDTLGTPFGWRRGDGDWLAIARSLLAFEPVAVVQTCGWDLWREEIPDFCQLYLLTPADLEPDQSPPGDGSGLVWISERRSPPVAGPVVAWHPRVLWVGIGCERGTDLAVLEAALERALAQENLAVEAIAGLASLDLKGDEPALLELAAKLNVPLRCFDAATLDAIAVPTPSAIVKEEVGTRSVAEAAAIAASDGPLVVVKQIVRGHELDAAGAATIAIARSAIEYTDRPGKIYLIGTGPGDLSLLTPAAKAAIAQVDAVIGYQLYLDLLDPLFHPGQIIEGTPITQEVQRANRAIALASRGLTVAVVSSGDCGIYAMGGLVLEALAARGWDGDRPQVETIPGITALQAAAARVGAPLMHDFCAISLSDLLTPWPVIQKRLEAAAIADFVTALYNPRSKTRTTQIEFAIATFRQHRPPSTPVILARSLYRPDETIILTTLDAVDPTAIDMLTVVLIGNQTTFMHQGFAITPRGYAVPSPQTPAP